MTICSELDWTYDYKNNVFYFITEDDLLGCYDIDTNEIFYIESVLDFKFEGSTFYRLMYKEEKLYILPYRGDKIVCYCIRTKSKINIPINLEKKNAYKIAISNKRALVISDSNNAKYVVFDFDEGILTSDVRINNFFKKCKDETIFVKRDIVYTVAYDTIKILNIDSFEEYEISNPFADEKTIGVVDLKKNILVYSAYNTNICIYSKDTLQIEKIEIEQRLMRQGMLYGDVVQFHEYYLLASYFSNFSFIINSTNGEIITVDSESEKIGKRRKNNCGKYIKIEIVDNKAYFLPNSDNQIMVFDCNDGSVEKIEMTISNEKAMNLDKRIFAEKLGKNEIFCENIEIELESFIKNVTSS